MSTKHEFQSLNNDTGPESEQLADESTDSLIEAIQNGATLSDIQGVSDETMKGIYKLAYDFYHQGKLNDAESLFRFLSIYDFYNAEYVMGLAAVYQLKNNYAKAIELYALAYTISKNDFRPMFYAGQCNLMLRQVVQANKCFEIIVARCHDKELVKKAKLYIAALDEMQTSIETKDKTEDKTEAEGI
ncbi:SycD/LcrH family type III secretion system chaperone [Pantoea agglomerans]|uniref:SycD/LcrH family type III secretion system chaperone n=1 Tax=Enterobacter agglomerans TaxID=549 RepID=UPI0013BE2B00|nr:SycD/LcrH family type III secretion system chaperone [Pantoea agglomerans]NEG59849.1 CesD/SycD/LcrH family type III secretion system chaperone [Pantoea agglomerans]NEG98818.1 CesD/SycD/LcrH family type III secretion system chaperone [Pantoea agglomerans]NEH05198.1 CesD/SycD/LcrH family type III secretion system chaperone [Pantoea agglomerans]NEH16187.1 CesD/SycD/LcrH family type III secretion system chaperone [Pantoea agglomerans]